MKVKLYSAKNPGDYLAAAVFGTEIIESDYKHVTDLDIDVKEGHSIEDIGFYRGKAMEAIRDTVGYKLLTMDSLIQDGGEELFFPLYIKLMDKNRTAIDLTAEDFERFEAIWGHSDGAREGALEAILGALIGNPSQIAEIERKFNQHEGDTK